MIFNISPITIGILFIIFIISITLVIFAPRSKNYYNADIFPIIKYINDNNKDIIENDLDIIKKENEWILWPDVNNVVNDYLVYPIFMFGNFSESRKSKCKKSVNLINGIPGVKTFAYLKISKKSRIKKNKKWQEISNDTLCCLFIMESPYVSKSEDCCIWTDGEIKKLIKNKLIIYDASKEHSIINNSDYPIYILMLDIKKPVKYPIGISSVKYNDEVHDFIKKNML
jgi:aspartyl/asparaginyl beta-hydroxylase (cupin superfamily)